MVFRMNKNTKDKSASVRSLLMNVAKNTGENYNALLLRFFQERFLARLGSSEYREQFVLKGGYLLLLQHITSFRPTVDIDMLGVRINSNPDTIKQILGEISIIDLKDGVKFDPDWIIYETIQRDTKHEGLRFLISVRLGTIRNKIKIDIAFGDVVPGGFQTAPLPPILDSLEFPKLLHYPFESIIAEKFQAIVYLGFANSRMKDFFDIIFLASYNTVLSRNISNALKQTFKTRDTDIESRFFVYEDEFIRSKTALWKTFIRKIHQTPDEFAVVISKLHDFIEPVLQPHHDDLYWSSEYWIWETIKK